MATSHAPVLKLITPETKQIGRFTLMRELGRGSIGIVYLAHDPVIDRSVAIKTFHPRLSPLERKRYQEQFINEARSAGRLSHPHIVAIYDAAYNDGGVSYIAMEYLQGRELSRLLERNHPFAIHDIAAIIWKIADALDYAHRNGVVHRDIKPANIFMIGENQPKIVDFGIARSPNRLADLEANNHQAPYTLFHNNILGTPTYMSPEQACGEPADARSDIYSLGAVMYQMLTGCKPFEADDTDDLLKMIALKMPPLPHEIDPEVPEALSAIVMRAMSKQPEKRYQHAREMARDIKRFLVKSKQGQPEKAAPPSRQKKPAPSSSPSTAVRFTRITAALTGAAALALFALHLLA